MLAAKWIALEDDLQPQIHLVSIELHSVECVEDASRCLPQRRGRLDARSRRMRCGRKVCVDPCPQRPRKRAHRLVLLVQWVVAGPEAKIAARLVEAANGRLEARKATTIIARFQPNFAPSDLAAQLSPKAGMAHQQLSKRPSITGLPMHQHPRRDAAFIRSNVRLGHQGAVAPKAPIGVSAHCTLDKPLQRRPVNTRVGLDAHQGVPEGIRADGGLARAKNIGLCARECSGIYLRPIGKPQCTLGNMLGCLGAGHC